MPPIAYEKREIAPGVVLYYTQTTNSESNLNMKALLLAPKSDGDRSNVENVQRALVQYDLYGRGSSYLRKTKQLEVVQVRKEPERLAEMEASKPEELGQSTFVMHYSGPEDIDAVVSQLQRLPIVQKRAAVGTLSAKTAPPASVHASSLVQTYRARPSSAASVLLAKVEGEKTAPLQVQAHVVLPAIANNNYAARAFFKMLAGAVFADNDHGLAWRYLRSQSKKQIVHHASVHIQIGETEADAGLLAVSFPTQADLGSLAVEQVQKIFHHVATKEEFEAWKTATLLQLKSEVIDPSDVPSIVEGWDKRKESDPRAAIVDALEKMKYVQFQRMYRQYLTAPALAILMSGTASQVQLVKTGLQDGKGKLLVQEVSNPELFATE